MLIKKHIQQLIVSPLLAMINWYTKRKAKAEHRKDRDFVLRMQKEEQELGALIFVPSPKNKREKKWQEQVAAIRSDFRKKFSRLVIWGHRDIYARYRFIYRAYYYTAKKLGIPTIWLEDEPANLKWLFPGDLVMVKLNSEPAPSFIDMNHLQPQPGIFYCVVSHYSHDFIRDLDKKQYLLRQEHRNTISLGLNDPKAVRLSDQQEGVYYNPEYRLLCQPYGTDLLPWEFLPPVFRSDSKEVNYVGSPGNPNKAIHVDFAEYLKSVDLHFNLFDKQTNARHQELIRQSRLAPMLGGSDLEENYPHCRMFKNISYGQLGYSNIPIHQKIYKDCHPPVGSLEEMSDYVLRMSEDDYVEMVREQQKVTQNYTFLQHLANLFRVF